MQGYSLALVRNIAEKGDIMSKNKSSQPDFSSKSDHDYTNSKPDFGGKPEKSTTSKTDTKDTD